MHDSGDRSPQVRRLEREVRDLVLQNYALQEQLERTASDLAAAHELLHAMATTKGWRALEAYRRRRRRTA